MTLNRAPSSHKPVPPLARFDAPRLDPARSPGASSSSCIRTRRPFVLPYSTLTYHLGGIRPFRAAWLDIDVRFAMEQRRIPAPLLLPSLLWRAMPFCRGRHPGRLWKSAPTDDTCNIPRPTDARRSAICAVFLCSSINRRFMPHARPLRPFVVFEQRPAMALNRRATIFRPSLVPLHRALRRRSYSRCTSSPFVRASDIYTDSRYSRCPVHAASPTMFTLEPPAALPRSARCQPPVSIGLTIPL
ncbi:hypothetical protein C8R47DRAFT_571503 [Mycena vitilis]|nr:hypothetical protein C8R47DRAFT_571503 [Mycena vitilis]